MSKSLGNVLDPFEVIDRFGADALRFYLLRDVTFGQDGSVSTTAFEQRYESELANELRQPRQPHDRDGRALPRRRRARRATLDPALARRLRRPAPSAVAELLDRAELTRGARGDLAARAPAEPLRRGARAVDSSPRTRRAPASSTACSRSLVEGLRVRRRSCCTPWMPGAAEQAARPRSARRRRLRLAAARSARGAVERGRARSSRCSPSSRPPPRDRQPHPPRLVRAARRRAAWPRRARRASRGCSPSGWTARAAARRSPPPSASRRSSPPSAATPTTPTGFDDARRSPSSRRSPRTSAARAIGETGPGLLPRPRAARRPGARLPRPDRARPRDRQAARHPHPRGRGRHDRARCASAPTAST